MSYGLCALLSTILSDFVDSNLISKNTGCYLVLKKIGKGDDDFDLYFMCFVLLVEIASKELVSIGKDVSLGSF